MNKYNTFETNVLDYFDELKDDSFEPSYCIFCKPSTFRHSIFQKRTMRVELCDCGFVYNNRQPKQEVLDDFYKKSDAMKTWSDLKTSPSQEKRQAEKFHLAVSFLRGAVESVCDIGCGTGYFLSKLPDTIERVGVDTHKESLDHAKKNGIDTYQMGIDEWFAKCKKDGKKFDAVTLWGVLEHVKNPIEVLENCHSILNRDGYIITCVPNVDSAVVRRFWKETFTFQPVHLWYFNHGTLLRAYEKAGFKYCDSWTIESEVKPLVRGLSGFGPYEPLPKWLEDKVMTKETLDKLHKEIILTSRGYKIVAIGRKNWSMLP
jgi:2-polyprenyl-3-methyl-5-hydroxy-6-metoxy-1,4-benzoquinol methylase